MAQPSSGKLSLPLMIVAFLTVAGFVYWLSITAQPTEIPVAEEEEEEPAFELSLELFQDRSSDLVGERVRIPVVEVASMLGIQAFWFAQPDGNEYLAQLDAELAATGLQLEQGDRVRITGTVREMDEEVLEAWVNQGVIPSDLAEEAGAVETFLAADDIEIEVPEEMEESPGGL